MRNRILIVLSLLALALHAQSPSKSYEYTVDLTNVVDDKLFIQLKAPAIATDEITFYLPKIIPGTYSIEDYGRFVSEFKAFDKKGKLLDVENTGINSWKIKNATKLAKISYWIDDTFDTDRGDPKIFEPAGTNIEADKNIIMNNSGLFGYFDFMKNIPFTLKVIRSENFYGSTGLIAKQMGIPLTKVGKEIPDPSKRLDVYQTNNYDELVDSPLMYDKPDTVIIRVANTEVLISSYSPNKVITAKEIAASVREVLMAQKEFLGGTLPVEKYAFIFYWTDKPVQSYGALEHSYSSLYHIPEKSISEVESTLRDFVAHEFFHIVTPLTIHSEEIQPFDFNDPKMSMHLWLYEGVTEYFAGSVQVKYGLIPREEYLSDLRKKIITSDRFINNVPFTDISRYTLDKYPDQYYNVYQKGALIGLCLDIKLRHLSKGQYGLQNLIADLSKKYGKSQSFKDEELFSEITALTYPEIGEFLIRYVGGSESLPLKNIFESVGVLYLPEQITFEISTGLESRATKVVEFEGKHVYQINKPDALNDQGKLLNFKEGDIILKLNGEQLPEVGPEIQSFFSQQKEKMKVGGTLQYTVLRLDENSHMHEVVLDAAVKPLEKKKKEMIEFSLEATPEQLQLREAWLTPK